MVLSGAIGAKMVSCNRLKRALARRRGRVRPGDRDQRAVQRGRHQPHPAMHLGAVAGQVAEYKVSKRKERWE